MDKLYTYVASVDSIYDADTITVTFDLGFKINFGRQKLRLYGIDAYEVSLRGDTTQEEKDKGIKARDRLREMLPEGSKILVETIKSKDKGKYGRYLANVYAPVTVLSPTEIASGVINEDWDGESYFNLNEWLVTQGYAVHRDY